MRYLFFIVILFLFLSGFAQPDSSIDSSAVYTFSPNDFGTLQKFDTSLISNQQTHHAYKSTNGLFVSTAKNGHPYKSLVFSCPIDLGFVYSDSYLNDYIYNHNNVTFYKNLKPFTLVEYLSSTKRDQQMTVIHSRKISNTFSFGVNYKMLHSPGFFLHQESIHHKLCFTLQYLTKNNRYGFYSDLFYNKLVFNENGGLDTSSLFIDEVFSKNAFSKVISKGAGITQFLNFLKETKADSLSPQTYKVNLQYTSSYSNTTNYFYDLSPFLFKRDAFLDTTTTFDSIYFSVISNKFVLSNTNRNAWLNIYLGVEQKYVFLKDQFKLTEINPNRPVLTIPTFSVREFNQTMPRLTLITNNSKRIQFGFNYEMVNGSYNQDDYFFDLSLLFDFSKKKTKNHYLKINNSSAIFHAPYQYTHMYSNHLIWDKHMSNIGVDNIGVKYKFHFFLFELNQIEITNYTYFDSLAMPRQLGKAMNLLIAKANFNFNSRWIGYNSTFVYQENDNEIIHLPNFSSKQSLFFNFKVFKKVLLLQPGVDVVYVKSFKADAYNPVLHAFINQDIVTIPDVLYYDIFINFALKRFRFFIKLQQANFLFDKMYIYQIPQYPLEPFMVKFGLNWRFHD